HLDDVSHFGDADIVVEHVDAAKGLQAGRHHGLDVAGVRYIGGERGRVAAFGGDDLDGLLRGSRVAIDAEHPGTLAREGHGGRLAIAPAWPDRTGSGHQRCLSLEPIHRLLPFTMCYRSPDAAKRNPATKTASCRACLVVGLVVRQLQCRLAIRAMAWRWQHGA